MKRRLQHCFDHGANPVPSIVAGPRRGVNRLRGELVGTQGGAASQGVGAIERSGRGAVTGRGTLLCLVLQQRERQKVGGSKSAANLMDSDWFTSTLDTNSRPNFKSSHTEQLEDTKEVRQDV